MINISSRQSYHIIAVALTLAFLIFRITDIGTIPKGFFCDEASIAYNAKSLLETGRDEHGYFFPIFFKAFGDHKSFLYIFATAISIKIFGESHFATRLPAAIFLALAMLAVYAFLTLRYHPAMGLVAIVLLGNEPWLNHFSHIAFCLSAIPLCIMLSMIFWYEGIYRNRQLLIISALFFSLTFYVYPSTRLFVPLLVIGLLGIYRDKFFRDREGMKTFGLFSGLAALCSIPFFYYLFEWPDFLIRPKYLIVFTTPFIHYSEKYKLIVSTVGYSGSEPTMLLRGLVALVNYISYYSPAYLFFSGDSNLRFGTPHFGVLGYLTMVGFISGLFVLMFRRNKMDKALLWWFFIYAIPGSLTWEDIPHSGRGIVGFIGMDIIATIGLWEVVKYLAALRKVKIVALSLFLIVCVSTYSYFIYSYYSYYKNRYSIQSSGWMQYGFYEMMEYIKQHHKDYNSVKIISTGLHYSPYIFALYYSGHDPRDWQENKTLPWKIDIETHHLNSEDYNEDVLYVFAPVPHDLDPRFKLLKYGYWEDGIGIAYGFYYFQDQKIPMQSN